MKIACFLIVLQLPTSLAIAQARYEPGYVIYQAGDTVRGKIKLPSGNLNPQSIDFEKEGKSSKLGLADISAFGNERGVVYRKFTVTVHTNPIYSHLAHENFSDEVRTQEAFLLLMATGIFDFYELQQDRVWYFFGTPGDTTTELLYRIKLSGLEIQEDNQFRNQLESLGSQRGLPVEKIKKLKIINYNYSDIRKAAFLINNTNLVKENQPGAERKRVYFFVRAGLIQYHFPSDFQGLRLSSSYISLFHFKNTSVFTGGFNIEYSLWRNSNQLKIGLGIGISHFEASTGKIDSIVADPGVTVYRAEKYKLNLTPILIEPYLCYQPMLASQVLPFVKLGFVFSTPSKKDNIPGYYREYKVDLNNNTVITMEERENVPVASINSTWVNPVFCVGVTYKRLGLEGSYWFKSQYGQSRGTGMDLSALSILIHYRLTK